MQNESKPLTAFSTHYDVYQCRIKSFDLSGASGTLQKVMDYVLHMHFGYAYSYIDSIVIFSASSKQHPKHLNYVLSDLAIFGFSGKKCSFVSSEIKFLGYKIGRGKHSPDSDKILAIKQLKRLIIKKVVSSVLGIFFLYCFIFCITFYLSFVNGLNFISL